MASNLACLLSSYSLILVSYFIMQSFFLNSKIFFSMTTAEILFYAANAAKVIFPLASLVCIYILCRRFFPARVNCWFCNQNSWVPYSAINCFDCRFCDQYNGFTNDGDYNKEIITKVPSSPKTSGTKTARTNGLCRTCNINQQLKLQQLASFSPVNELNYDAEIEDYGRQLEVAYKLCDDCNLVLTQTLQTQHYEILNKRLNSQCTPHTIAEFSNDATSKYAHFFHRIAAASAASLFFLALDSHFMILKWIPLLEINDGALIIWPVAVFGALFHFFYILTKRPFKYLYLFEVILWTVIQITIFQAHNSWLIVTAALASMSHVYSLKEAAKTNFKCAAPPIDTPVNKFAEIISNSVKNSVCEQVTPLFNKTRPENSIRKEVTPIPNKPLLKNEKMNLEDDIDSTTSRIITRSQASKDKKNQKTNNNVSPREKQQAYHKSQSPPPEFYQRLTDLRLGTPAPEDLSKVPSNYLFEKIELKPAKEQNILKPSKFNLNTPKGICAPRVRPISPKVPSLTTTHMNAFTDLNVAHESPLSSYGRFFPVSPSMYSFPAEMPYYMTMGQTGPYSPPPAYVTPQLYSPYASHSSQHSDVYSSSPSLNGTSFSAMPHTRDKWEWLKIISIVVSACINIVFIIWTICNR